MIKKIVCVLFLSFIIVTTGLTDTSCIFFHRGQQVTAISNGATESTLTLGEAVGSRSWKDNDRVVVWDGTGYKKEGLIDEASILTTDTSLDVDNGAGALVTDIEKVGRSLDFDATRYAQAANNTIHDITTQDIGISAWVRADSNASGVLYIISKQVSDQGYHFYLMSNGKLELYIKDADADVYILTGNTDLRDNKWHHVAVILDKSDATNCKLYLDGYEGGTTTKTGTLANVGSLTNTAILYLAIKAGEYPFDGQIRDVILSYPADIMAAGEMGASGEILELATKPRDFITVNHEDAWALYDNAANTTIASTNTGSAPANLTASANTDTFDSQEAFISKSLLCDGGMEQGGIGGIANIASTWTITKDTSIVKSDTRSLKAVNVAGNDNDKFTIKNFILTLNDDYYYSFWLYVSAIHVNSDLYFDIDGAANIVARRLDTGTDDKGVAYATGAWLYFEGCFEANQNGVHVFNIRTTGAGAGANSATIYVEFN